MKDTLFQRVSRSHRHWPSVKPRRKWGESALSILVTAGFFIALWLLFVYVVTRNPLPPVG